jgi:NodT family efflux transporter outer membrane factor (OMF) lipoprotein
VADGYVGYRSCQQLVAASARDVASREATAGLISMLVEAGFRAPVEGETVAAGLADAQAELANQRAQCDLAVKSLVVLVGIPEQTLRAQLGQGDSDVLPVPAAFEVTTLPVNVLAQRPDLAAAERGLAAATADVGVAEANRYPRLSLSGSLSISMLNGVSTVTSRPWSIGPSLTVPVFDAGQRRAEVAAAAARLAQQQANYAMSVRLAVAEVERAMVVLGSSQAQESRARAAVSGYARVLTSTEAHLRAGGASLLALEEARRNANSTERKLLVLQRERVRAWISLYKAVGGGWSASAGDNQ